LPIGGQSDKKAKAMMHVDEGILGNDAWWWRHWCGWKELDPGLTKYDGIHVGDMMEQACCQIHYELAPPLPVMSNHSISALQWGHQAFLLSKSGLPMATLMAIPTMFCQSLGGRTIWFWGELDMSYQHLTCPTPWWLVTLFVFHFLYFVLFTKRYFSHALLTTLAIKTIKSL
jgi:hypothetical protein